MAQTTEAMSMIDALVEAKIGAGSWIDIGGSGNEVKPDGFERKKGEANTFVGDSPIILRGKRGSGTVSLKVLYTEVSDEAHLLLYNAFVDADRVQIRWSPKGGNVGDKRYTSDALGFLTKALPPGGEAGSADPIMTEFMLACGNIAMDEVAGLMSNQVMELPAVTQSKNGKAKITGKLKPLDIQVSINADTLTYGDIKLISKFSKGSKNVTPEQMEKVMDFMDRCLVGGIDKYPISATPAIMEAIFDAVNGQRADHEKNLSRRRPRGRS